MTYSAYGLRDFRASKLRVIDIPVANGKTMQSLIQESPTTFLSTFSVIAFEGITITRIQFHIDF